MAIEPLQDMKRPITFWVLGFLFLSAHGQQIEVIYEDSLAAAVRCTGCSQEVTVRLSGSSEGILGRTANHPNGTVTFRPLFAFDRQLMYEVWDGPVLVDSFRPLPAISQKTELVAIYPRDSLLPENLLKFHLVFSSPMGVGDSYQQIHFFEGDSEVFPILDLRPELWNHDRTILTLWLDPGRIKRDLLRQTKLGIPLRREESYRMMIDTTWLDRKGNSLSLVAEKQFRTIQADRTVPGLTSDQVSFPRKPGDPLTIRFDEPMDFLLLRHAIYVMANNIEIEGQIETSGHERNWSFLPREPWSIGTDYRLIIETRLEDLAGNNLLRPFDRSVEDQPKGSSKELTFHFGLPQ